MGREAVPGAAPGEASLGGVVGSRRAEHAGKPSPPSPGAKASSRPRRASLGGRPTQDRELRAQGRQTLRNLLEAGLAEFDERGFQAVRVDDIVRRAQISHGTFYLYFSNKEELFRALAQEVAGEMISLADSLPPIDPGPEGRTELRAWLARFVEVYEHYGPVIRAWTEAEIGGSEFGRLGTDVLTEFSRVLTGRIRRSSSPDINPQIAALAVVAMIERFNYYVLSRQVDVSRDEMLDTLATVTHAGLFGGSASRY